MFIFIFFVLLASTVSADFTAYSDTSDINACLGEVFEQKIHVQSEFSQPTAFTIRQQKNLGGKIVPGTFTLEPNEEITVSHFISNLAEGDYNSEIVIEGGGVKKLIQQDVSVEKCQKIRVNADAYSYSNCPCTPTVYRFNLTNAGNSPETFDLSVDTKESYYTLSQEPVFIAPGETVPVYLYLKLPCDRTGNFSFTFQTEALSTGFATQTPFFLQVRQGCYDFNLQLGKANLTHQSNIPEENFTFPKNDTYNFCLNNTYSVPFFLTNKGEVNNSYQLLDNSPDFIQILFNNETLDVNETLEGVINATPRNVSEGEYSSELTIVTDRGSFAKDYNIDYFVDDCLVEEGYNIQEWFNKLQLVIYIGLAFLFVLAILLLYFVIRKPVKKQEIPKKPKEIKKDKSKHLFWVLIAAIILIIALLGYFAFTWYTPLSALNETTTEAPNQTLDNETADNITKNVSGVMVNKTGTNKSLVRKAAITTLSHLNIYKYYILGGIFILILIVLLFLTKPWNFLKHGLYSISRKKTSKKTKYLYLLILLLLIVGVILFIMADKPETEDKKNITGKVSRQPINETQTSDKINRSSVEAKTTFDYLNIYKYYILAGFILLALVILILNKGAGEQANKYFLLILALVVVLLLVSLFFYTKQSETFTQTNTTVSLEQNSTHYVMKKNTERTINFGQYVEGGTGDVKLKATPMKNITVNITDSRVKLTPDKNWYGQRVFNLIAEDETGAREYSPDISVLVLNREPWYKMLWNNTGTFFSGYVILILAGVIITIGLLLYYFKN